tara:strand:+ start:438 stop:1211 length:774 start_codon:yes stop_codon:yes gene_type:complete
MDKINVRLNDDYYQNSYLISIRFHNRKADCDTFKRYLFKRSGDLPLYVTSGYGGLYAIVGRIADSRRDLHNLIVNYFNNSEKKRKIMYVLEVIDVVDLKYGHYKPFDYWLSISIYLVETWGNCKYNFHMDCADKDFINRIKYTGYIDDFRYGEESSSIQEYRQFKRSQRIHIIEMKEVTEQLKKELFYKKINTRFRFTDDESECLSKKIVCGLLDLDDTSKKEIRRLNVILTNYGVKYSNSKMIKRVKGVYTGVSLK